MDITTVFSAIILWLIFGFFSPLLNCDLQYILTKNVYAKHIGCIICVFFLIAVFVAPPTQELGVTWVQTLILYVFFIMATKSKLFPILLVLLLLVIDQSVRLEIERRLALDPDADVRALKTARDYLVYAIAILIVIGCAWYYVIKYKEYGDSFSNVTFFFGSNSCKSLK
jgi:hypothetical protein